MKKIFVEPTNSGDAYPYRESRATSKIIGYIKGEKIMPNKKQKIKVSRKKLLRDIVFFVRTHAFLAETDSLKQLSKMIDAYMKMKNNSNINLEKEIDKILFDFESEVFNYHSDIEWNKYHFSVNQIDIVPIEKKRELYLNKLLKLIKK